MKKRLIIFLVLALAGAAADIWTKAKAEADYPRIEKDEEPLEVIPGCLNFIYTENKGAAFGLLRNQTWGPVLLVGVSLLAIGFLVWFVVKTKERPTFHAVTCGLILGGVLGNVYDRVLQDEHQVRDFIDFYVTRPVEDGDKDGVDPTLHCGHQVSDQCWHWYTFNLADAYISVGVILLLLLSFLPETKKKKQAEKKEKAP